MHMQVRYLVHREFADARRSLPVDEKAFRGALRQLSVSLGCAPPSPAPRMHAGGAAASSPAAAAAAAAAPPPTVTLGALLAAAQRRTLRFDFPARGGVMRHIRFVVGSTRARTHCIGSDYYLGVLA
jgi:hypothetical protein